MAMFSQIQYIPQVARRVDGHKGRASMISVQKPPKQTVIRASGEQEAEECDTNVVPGNFPLGMTRRSRQYRKSPILRAAFQEKTISAANFVLPLFIHEGEDDVPIEAMPGCSILGWRHGLLDEVYKARDVGVKSFFLFPKILDPLKTPTGDEAFNNNGLIPRTIRLLKDKYPDIVIYTNVALDPHSSNGYDDIIRKDGFSRVCKFKKNLCSTKDG